MKNLQKKILILVLFISVFVAGASLHLAKASSDDAIARYEEAKTAYFDKRYSDAKRIFTELLNEQPENGHLLFDLANVHYKEGNIGQALQYYEKARLYIPREDDLKFNLNTVQTALNLTTETSFQDYVYNTFYFWAQNITFAEFKIFLLVLNGLFWSVVLVKMLRQNKILSLKTVMGALFLVYALCGGFLKYNKECPDRFGIVLPHNVDVMSNFLGKDEPLFQLHQGMKVEIIDRHEFDSSDKWLRITLPQGQKGWIHAKDLGVI